MWFKQKILQVWQKLMSNLAKKYIEKNKIYIIGITGSVGKTSARMIIYQILKKKLDNLKIYTAEKNFNGEYGLPLSIFQIEDYKPTPTKAIKSLFVAIKKTFFDKNPPQVLLLEYGIDHPGEMDLLLQIAKPHIGVLTSIDKVHLQYFENLNQLANEKSKLALASKETVFLNYDNCRLQQLYQVIEVDKFLFKTQPKDFEPQCNQKLKISPDIYIQKFDFDLQSFKTKLILSIGDQQFRLKTNLFGYANWGYMGVGLVILQILAEKFNQIIEISPDEYFEFKLQPSRFSIFEGVKNGILIDSTYNAAPESMKAIIDTTLLLKKQLEKQGKNFKLIGIFGDMRELGDAAEQEHRNIALYFSQFDELFLLGENTKNFTQDELTKIGFDENKIHWFQNSKQLGEKLKEYVEKLNQPYIALFKGSQNTIFLEEAVKFLLKNPADGKNLCRQEDWRIQKKGKFFSE